MGDRVQAMVFGILTYRPKRTSSASQPPLGVSKMAVILDAFVGRCVEKLSEFIAGEMSMMLGVKEELNKLQRRMERISVFLESAERKRHTEPNINMWVRELKDVMYDADDIIDLCMIEGSKLLEDHPSESAVRCPLSLFSCFSCIKFRHEIGGKIRELNDRLKEINEDRSILSALEYTKKDAQVRGVNHRQTFPIEIKSDIVGTQIEDATQSLVESLIKEDNKKYRILGIVGMGGIGKTTLASNIYNNKIIKEKFPIRVWVCISQDFSETKLLKEIIRGVGGNYEGAETKAELVPHLSSILSTRFFIVLDDVWEKDVWEHLLRYAVENAAASGRIIITTRDMHVARSIRAEMHHVDKMDNDNGWKLLCRIVFGDDDDDDDDEGDISSLKEIGAKIVEKCDGLPLAIKIIAGVLRSKERSNIEWDKVVKSEVWSMSQLQEQLPGALFLSYEYLPSHLKQCFLYCSLFPEDYDMHRDDLIHYWVAEGFIKRKQGDKIMEDLAEEYFRELIGRNLLQPSGPNYCKMHDLLRSLALFLTEDESTFVGDGQSPKINPLAKIRRLSMVNIGERVEVPDVIKQQKCLRTLLLFRSHKAKIVENELFGSLRLLRVMVLRDTVLESLPGSVGDLLHLRYLDLNGTQISALPESIGCLANLQILTLAFCGLLHTLPKAITKLCNLRCLCLEGTPLTHVPKGIGKLRHLNHLEGFVVCHDEGCGLEELQSLSQLRFLEIKRLERAQPGGAQVLANSHSLRTLILDSTPYPGEEEAISTQRIDEIYNELYPPSTYLQRLEIHYFFGTGFPSWMMSASLGASFPNLISIDLDGCKSCMQLPPLGLLPWLKYLYIRKACAIKAIGPEFLGPRASSAATSFPKLEELILQNMDNWEEWSFGLVDGVGEGRRGAPKLLPRLMKLKLEWCPKLRAFPPLGLLPQLKYLSIERARSIKTIGPEFLGPGASSAEASFPKLEELEFISMENWEEWLFGMVEGVGEERRGAPKLLPRLSKLTLFFCPKLRALPEGLQHATNLQELTLSLTSNLKEINNLPLTDSLEIRANESLERVSNLPSLKSLKIDNCEKLEHVENLDKLQLLRVELSPSTETSTTDADGQRDCLPQWLLELLGQHTLQEFDLTCSLRLLKTFLKDGPNWPIIQSIAQVIRIEEHWRSSGKLLYIEYTKDPPTFKTNVGESK